MNFLTLGSGMYCLHTYFIIMILSKPGLFLNGTCLAEKQEIPIL